MKKILMMILMVGLLTSMAVAQSEYHKSEFYVGYSHDASNGANLPLDGALNKFGYMNAKGFNASVTYNFRKFFGFKADVDGHFHTGELRSDDPVLQVGQYGGPTKNSRFNFRGGLQVKNNSKEARFKPFGHVMIGLNRHTEKIENANQFTKDVFGSDEISATAFATTFGGGLDIKLSRKIDLRVIQFNYTTFSIGERALTKQNVLTQFPNFNGVTLGGGQTQYTFSFGLVFH